MFRPSPFSADHIRAYKSHEAYNEVAEGWVKDVKVMTTSGLNLVKGKVIRLISLNFGNNTFPWFFHSSSLLLTEIMSELFLLTIFLKQEMILSLFEKNELKRITIFHIVQLWHNSIDLFHIMVLFIFSMSSTSDGIQCNGFFLRQRLYCTPFDVSKELTKSLYGKYLFFLCS